MEVLCRPALPSKKSRTPTTKVITATGGLYALEDAFTRVQEALRLVSCETSGEATDTDTDTRTSIIQTTIPPLPSLHVMTFVAVLCVALCSGGPGDGGRD